MTRSVFSTVLVAVATLALSACTSAGLPATANPTPSGTMPTMEATPAPAGMQTDDGMAKTDDTMGMPSATPANGPMPMATATPAGGAMKQGDTMANPTVTPADGMMKQSDPMGTPAPTPDGMMKQGDGMATPGAMVAPSERYVAYSPAALTAASQNGRAVLFFYADWCPTCRAADAEYKANPAGIPADVTILQVNYDTATALKQKYNIVYQHSYIQVDGSGRQVTRWDGGGIADLLANLK